MLDDLFGRRVDSVSVGVALAAFAVAAEGRSAEASAAEALERLTRARPLVRDLISITGTVGLVEAIDLRMIVRELPVQFGEANAPFAVRHAERPGVESLVT